MKSGLAYHLRSAQGYMELGMFVDAANELEKIDPESRGLPQVMAHRLAIYTAMKKWDMAEGVARQLVKVEPENPDWWISSKKRRAVNENLGIQPWKWCLNRF